MHMSHYQFYIALDVTQKTPKPPLLHHDEEHIPGRCPHLEGEMLHA